MIPIIPPGVDISANSTLFKRVGTKQDGRGKTPGLKGQDGRWYGFDWVPYECDEHDLARWNGMGAGVGIKTGDMGDGTSLIAIDADTKDHAEVVLVGVRAALGALPVRVGNYPKALYLCRVRGAFQYQRIEFGQRDENNRLLDRVEVLSDGRQFVAHGIHPKTMRPYEWPRDVPPYADLPVFEPEQITALLGELAKKLPQASEVKTEGATAEQSQGSLRGDLEAVRRAVRAIPNTHNTHPMREDYLAVGYAIRAALPDNEDEALELFQEWCEGWTAPDGSGNDPDVVEADWRRMKPPYRRGASWLYAQAEELSGGAYSRADAWFENLPAIIPAEVSLFDVSTRDDPNDSTALTPIKWVRPGEWAGVVPPEREWEVEGWIPRYEVCLLYGDGGIGKTLVIHQYATAAAAGRDWLGQKTRPAKVMCFFCEDSEDELLRRQIDINKAMGLTWEEIDENLRIASRKYMDNLLILWDRNTGALKRQAVWEQLRNDALEFGAEVIIVDTIADTFGGNEIDRAQVNAFIKSCLGRLAQEINGTVIALGHPSMSGKQSGTGTSGSTAWSNAVRSRMYLRYPKGVEKGNIREIEGMKLNYGAKGNLLKLRWHGGAFEVLAASVAPIAGESAPKASQDGLATVEGAADMAVFDAVQAQTGLGVAMSLKPTSPHFAPKVLKRREPDLLAGFSIGEVEAAFDRLERSGAVRETEVGRKGNRHPVMGYEAVVGVMFGEGAMGDAGNAFWEPVEDDKARPGVFD
ncbi:putative ATPase, RecA family protein [Devosia sp. H5989]|nr:putative ATPase, RecA family protein [Devosia sp. H5989]